MPDSMDRGRVGFAFYLPVGGHELFIDGWQGDPMSIKRWLTEKSISGVDVDAISAQHHEDHGEFTEVIEEILIDNEEVIEALRADLLATVHDRDRKDELKTRIEQWLEDRENYTRQTEA